MMPTIPHKNLLDPTNIYRAYVTSMTMALFHTRYLFLLVLPRSWGKQRRKTSSAHVTIKNKVIFHTCSLVLLVWAKESIKVSNMKTSLAYVSNKNMVLFPYLYWFGPRTQGKQRVQTYLAYVTSKMMLLFHTHCLFLLVLRKESR